MFLTYDITKNNIGDIIWFLISSDNINKLILKYPSYAHGTIEKNGIIDNVKILTKNFEYALRPSINSKLWNELLMYKKTEEYIYSFFNNN